MELSWIGSVQSRNRVWLSWVWVESDPVQIVIASSTTPITAHCLAKGGVSLNHVVGFSYGSVSAGYGVSSAHRGVSVAHGVILAAVGGTVNSNAGLSNDMYGHAFDPIHTIPAP